VTEHLPRFMRAAVVDAYGPPENVRLAEGGNISGAVVEIGLGLSARMQ
jgi:hypothetical protein